ncbi:thioredoxin-like protein [Mucilaginibacter oryzae]|uniref:Thioredoxin-like protein n=1 Tax=Mucilaginibacter oryzae TaxID=468058 RepID=A0A316HDU2_9SPHI|nr:thioredoxin fold domain-containing protein [Mucilaginibacter oryzae]PWK78738.1 thioredoxin-like protein [Mucilaginibacter oryzae]
MKPQILCFCLLLSLLRPAQAQQQTGIRFLGGSWKQLLAAAQAKKQPIFVDVYTDWCGPCKRMEKEVFPLPEVGKFYNDNFICYRLNAEKGEGPGIAKAFGVSAYPTWLYLDQKGVLRSKRTDYMPAAEFIAAAKAALGNDSTSLRLAALDARFAVGERSRPFFHTYLEARTAVQLDNAKILNAYVATLKKQDLNAAELRFLLNNCGRTWSAAVPLIAGNLQVFDNAEQKQVANSLFENTLYFAWGDAAKAGDRQTALQAMTIEEKLHPLLTEAAQLTADHAALYHSRKLQLADGLKKAGYRLAVKQMAVDTTLARQKDKELFDKVMAPFLSGQQDSTKIPGFAEEKLLAARQYSGNVATLLYEVADAFRELLPGDDAAQKDAAKWAERAYLLVPNEHTKALVGKLKGK